MVQVGQTLRIGGWVKTGREAGGGAWVFLEVNDGSCFQSLQVPQDACLRHACARQYSTQQHSNMLDARSVTLLGASSTAGRSSWGTQPRC